MIVRRLLGVLEDVDGVRGSFLVAPGGQLLTHAMPPEFELFDLQLSAARVARVLGCSAANGLHAEDGVFDFGDHKLLVRELLRGWLCVLCSARVNMRSLRLTARLVARSMPADLVASAVV